MDDSSGWVSLSEAAKILGVHPATVRSWADRGYLPSQRTPGGHRRFRTADLNQWIVVQEAGTLVEAELLVQSAIGRVRLEIGEGQVAEEAWFRRLDQQGHEAMALYGRSLLELLQRYLTSASESILAEVRTLGLKYGEVLKAQGLTLSEAVEGFFTFNDFVLDTTLKMLEINRSGAERGDVVRRVYAFTRETILALIESFGG